MYRNFAINHNMVIYTDFFQNLSTHSYSRTQLTVRNRYKNNMCTHYLMKNQHLLIVRCTVVSHFTITTVFKRYRVINSFQTNTHALTNCTAGVKPWGPTSTNHRTGGYVLDHIFFDINTLTNICVSILCENTHTHARALDVQIILWLSVTGCKRRKKSINA